MSKPNNITRDILKDKLSEISAEAHYVYALMSGLPKEIFYILRHCDDFARMKVKNRDADGFTLREFLAECDRISPDETFSINFFVHRNAPHNRILVDEWLLYSNNIKRLSKFTSANLKNMFDEFLECYCEKCLRDNRPFEMTPDTIEHFGFTAKDIVALKPRLDRFNMDAKKRIRAEYDALAKLDFIHQELSGIK